MAPGPITPYGGATAYFPYDIYTISPVSRYMTPDPSTLLRIPLVQKPNIRFIELISNVRRVLAE
jgi:hypothetical protein